MVGGLPESKRKVEKREKKETEKKLLLLPGRMGCIVI
jgi:hypothetical protein